MNKSETIGKLTEALSKAQSQIEGSRMDGDNPFFKSRYSTLASVWDACRIPLTDNGLAVVQTATFIPEHPEIVAIETTLSHVSGEFVTGIMVARPTKPDPQSVGSCVTYLRRYSLAAICGISPEDDDGNAATGNKETGKQEKIGGDVKLDWWEGEPAKKQAPSPLRKKFFASLNESGTDKDIFKEWLASVGWIIPTVSGELHFTNLDDKHITQMLDKWESAIKTFNLWVDKQTKEENAKEGPMRPVREM